MFSYHFDDLPPAIPGSDVKVLCVGGEGMFPEAYVFLAILIDGGAIVAVIEMSPRP